MDDKSSKVYVEYLISTCMSKEAINLIQDKLDESASKSELRMVNSGLTDRLDKVQRELDSIKSRYSLKDDIEVILDRNLERTKAQFLHKQEFMKFKEDNSE